VNRSDHAMSNLVLVLSSGVTQLPAAIITKAFVPILIIGTAKKHHYRRNYSRLALTRANAATRPYGP